MYRRVFSVEKEIKFIVNKRLIHTMRNVGFVVLDAMAQVRKQGMHINILYTK